MDLAPIVLFVYNRPWHTEETLHALMQNELADQSALYIYADGPKTNATEDELKKITEVHHLIRIKKWCKEVHITEAENNKGLADSIISGVTEIVNQYGKVIVLEDDIITSRGFLKYMNDALDLYKDDENIMEVSGYMFPINSSGLPDTFFYNVNSCWGWGTWARAWKSYNGDALKLYSDLVERNTDWELFNGFQGNAFKEQLLANVEKRLNTWAVKWHSTIFINNGKVLHPNKSLTGNIGFDGSGTNCLPNDDDIQNLANSITVNRLPAVGNKAALNELKKYFLNLQNSNNVISSQNPESLSYLRRLVRRMRSFKNVLQPAANANNGLIDNKELRKLRSLPRYKSYDTFLFKNKLHIVDSVTYLSSLYEIFESGIYKFEPKDTENISIIDCGANIGLATIYFKNRFPKAKIISYEADPDIFKALEKNIISFRYNDVEAVNAAVSDKEGIINFHIEGGHSGMISDDGGPLDTISVKSIRLKNVLARYNNVTFLKIDIEGHEDHVLPDIAEELKKVQYLFLEYHSFLDKQQQLDVLLKIIEQAGFRYYLREAYNKMFPFINREIFLNMDFLVNIFCYRD